MHIAKFSKKIAVYMHQFVDCQKEKVLAEMKSQGVVNNGYIWYVGRDRGGVGSVGNGNESRSRGDGGGRACGGNLAECGGDGGGDRARGCGVAGLEEYKLERGARRGGDGAGTGEGGVG